MKKLIAATMILASTLTIAGCDKDAMHGWKTLQENETLIVSDALKQLDVFTYHSEYATKYISGSSPKIHVKIDKIHKEWEYYGDCITWRIISEN